MAGRPTQGHGVPGCPFTTPFVPNIPVLSILLKWLDKGMARKSIARLKRDMVGIAPQHHKNILWDVVKLKDGRYGRVKDGHVWNISLTKRLGHVDGMAGIPKG